MKRKDIINNDLKKKRVVFHAFFHKSSYRRDVLMLRLFQVMLVCCFVIIGIVILKRSSDNRVILEQQKKLMQKKHEATKDIQFPVAGIATVLNKFKTNDVSIMEPKILEEYQILYYENSDIVGWLKISDTIIDYPVMQTMEDESYYLSYDFYRQENSNGSLILDTDSNVGIGMEKNDYMAGKPPSTNLIIHGHTMKSGQMFGNLQLYKDETYGKAHNIICFDSLYEERTYELIAVFYSQVYNKDQNVFKYYNFFQADTKEEFTNWYKNIKDMSLYDTGVTAEFGDEFITLSCCSYQVEDGRFVVIGKRIKCIS